MYKIDSIYCSDPLQLSTLFEGLELQWCSALSCNKCDFALSELLFTQIGAWFQSESGVLTSGTFSQPSFNSDDISVSNWDDNLIHLGYKPLCLWRCFRITTHTAFREIRIVRFSEVSYLEIPEQMGLRDVTSLWCIPGTPENPTNVKCTNAGKRRIQDLGWS